MYTCITSANRSFKAIKYANFCCYRTVCNYHPVDVNFIGNKWLKWSYSHLCWGYFNGSKLFHLSLRLLVLFWRDVIFIQKLSSTRHSTHWNYFHIFLCVKFGFFFNNTIAPKYRTGESLHLQYIRYHIITKTVLIGTVPKKNSRE